MIIDRAFKIRSPGLWNSLIKLQSSLYSAETTKVVSSFKTLTYLRHFWWYFSRHKQQQKIKQPHNFDKGRKITNLELKAGCWLRARRVIFASRRWSHKNKDEQERFSNRRETKPNKLGLRAGFLFFSKVESEVWASHFFSEEMWRGGAVPADDQEVFNTTDVDCKWVFLVEEQWWCTYHGNVLLFTIQCKCKNCSFYIYASLQMKESDLF